MAQERAWAEDVDQICLQLVPPLLFASLDSWNHAQGSSPEHLRDAADRVAGAHQWVRVQVPELLRRLHNIIDEQWRESAGEVDVETRSRIAVAAAVFVSPRKRPKAGKQGQPTSTSSREPWITTTNTELALAILQHPRLSAEKGKDACLVGLDQVLVTHLLQAYLKPLFSTTPSPSINASTGRATRASSNIVDGAAALSGGGLMEGEVVWKGGDVERGADSSLMGRSIVVDVEGDVRFLHARHRALGCCNVLYVCFCSIQTSHSMGAHSWNENWALVLPPLLALLEDASPLYRLLGARILATTLLKTDGKERQIGTLLLRTGVAPLLRQVLQSSLTYISTRLSAALIQSATEALFLLTIATTADLHTAPSSSSSSLPYRCDGGKERFEQMSTLVDEGVLRVWVYASSTTDIQAEEAACLGTLDDDNSSDDEDGEADNVVNTSIDTLTRLAQADALAVGLARYLDLVLEFLTGQLLGLETRMARRLGPNEASMSLDREISSSRAVEALIRACKNAPGVRTWSTRCLAATARCWAILNELREDRRIQELQSHLRSIVKALEDAQPDVMRPHLQMLLTLDERTFAPLLGTAG